MSRIVDISMIYKISEKFEMYEKYEIVKIVEMVYISQILEQTEIFDTNLWGRGYEPVAECVLFIYRYSNNPEKS